MRQFRQFVEVAERRSISRAAEHLHLSQPALSRSIRQLEQSYGVDLFIRTGSGVTLSAFGTLLYGSAIRALRALDQGREEINLLKGSAKAPIRIAAGDLWGLVILPDVIRKVAAAHSDVLIHVDITDEATRFEGLRNGTYDLIFGVPWENYDTILPMQSEWLVRQGGYIYCDKNHPLALKGQITPDDFLRWRWISHGYDRGTRPAGANKRDYAVRADTTMHAVLLLRDSPLLTSASSGFAKLFESFGIVSVGVDPVGAISESGPIYPARILQRPFLKELLDAAREHTKEMDLPVWKPDRQCHR